MRNDFSSSRQIASEHAALFTSAREALRAEDKQLQSRFMLASKRDAAAHGRTAPGLAYWLFETTLVYVIFKRWLAEYPVAWEHATQYQPASEPSVKLTRATCDLVLFRSWKMTGPPAAAFEAKWWNNGGRKTSDSLLKDVRRLQRNYPTSTRYLLTFWWGQRNALRQDVSRALSFCKSHDLSPAQDLEASSFPTTICVRGRRQPGYFVCAGLRCP